MEDKRQIRDSRNAKTHEMVSRNSDFVLDKAIFSNIFEKDIRRIYIYRKSERLAKAIHLITPAFGSTPSLRRRLDEISIGLIDAAVLPPASAQKALSQELLALSSMLSVARTSALLSEMNADLIAREVHNLLQEIAAYEEPRLSLDEVPSLADFAKNAPRPEPRVVTKLGPVSSGSGSAPNAASEEGRALKDTSLNKGQTTEKPRQSDRQDAILAVLATKGTSYIKDISMVIKDVSEKTIQRELQALVFAGKVEKSGERRWTQYSLV